MDEAKASMARAEASVSSIAQDLRNATKLELLKTAWKMADKDSDEATAAKHAFLAFQQQILQQAAGSPAADA